MDTLLERLRTYYLLFSVPALAIFALTYFTAAEPLVEPKAAYWTLIILYAAALIVVPATSFVLKKAVKKCEGNDRDTQADIYARAYRIRIASLNIVSYFTGPVYLMTLERGSVYLFAILTVIILLSYPSSQYVFHEKR